MMLFKESGEEVALTYVRQIDTERHQELVNLLEDVKLPTIEYYTVKLDNDMGNIIILCQTYTALQVSTSVIN